MENFGENARSTDVQSFSGEKPTKKEYFYVCLKIGLMLLVDFVSRTAGSVILSLTAQNLVLMDPTMAYFIESLISFAFLYIIPFTFTLILFGYFRREKVSGIYKKPKRLGKALANFPNIYGLGMMVNIITITVITLVQSSSDLGESFNTVNALTVTNIPSALILLFQLVVIAPVFEEFWFRGIVFGSLKKFGVGFSIVVSGVLFGLIHANFNQFFYASVLGICFAYITYATGSIVATTILHAIYNSISGIIMFFLALPSIQKYMTSKSPEEIVMTDGETAIMLTFVIFGIVALILAFFGSLSVIPKIRKILRGYNIPHVWTELSTGKKTAMLLTSFTMIISLVLIIDTFTFGYIRTFFIKLFI